MGKWIDRVLDAARGWPLLVLFLLTYGWMLHVAPENVGQAKVGLTIYGVSKIALCGYLGYWVDRLCFRTTDRPHLQDDDATVRWAWMRRALIVAASLLAGALIP
ncbi:MAG TPA: hypothetical protein VGE09_11175 [Pseudoxanthomonas sp.]